VKCIQPVIAIHNSYSYQTHSCMGEKNKKSSGFSDLSFDFSSLSISFSDLSIDFDRFFI
jgi:hypothetical protein